MMDVRAIHAEADYKWALAEVKAYFIDAPKLGTPEGDRFDVLCDLVEVYEKKQHPIEPSDPVRVLRFLIKNAGRSQAELGRLIGRTRASEILNRRRALTLDQIRTISEAWHVPVAALTPPYALARGEPVAEPT